MTEARSDILDDRHVVVLDSLRGIAALEVAGGHAQWLLWLGVTSFVAQPGLGPIFGFAVDVFSRAFVYAHEAVIVFFLISGFAIHFREAGRIANGKSTGFINLSEFARRRFRRLFPPLAVALVLTAVLDRIGMTLNPGYYLGRTLYPLINSEIGGPAHYSLAAFVASLAFQGDIILPRYGSNSVLWSLSYEVWYYAAYPILVYLSYRFGGIAAFAASAVVSLGAWAIPGSASLPIPSLVSYWMTWCAGALLAEIWHGRFGRPRLAREILIAGGLTFVAFFALDSNGSLAKALWILGTWLVMYGLIFAGIPANFRRSIRRVALWTQKLGDCSYTLYVIHAPIFALVSAWWLSTHLELPGTPILAVCVLVLVVGLSVVGARLIEKPFKSRPSSGASPRIESGPAG